MLNKLLRAFATVGVIAIAATVVAQDKLSKGDKKWMEEEVGPIITKQEIAMFQQIDKDDRKLFKELFWMRRDYDPRTQDNEYRKDYEQRIKAADDNFKSRRRKGSESDMGKIFLLMGAPDERQRGGSAEEGGLPRNPSARENDFVNPIAGIEDDISAGARDIGSRDTMVWVYNPNPSLGIPDGLAVEFWRPEQFSYRIGNLDDIEEHLEGAKEQKVAN